MISYDAEIKDAYSVLKREHDLSPFNAIVNTTLNKLVHSLVTCHATNCFQQFSRDTLSMLPSFRQLCAKAEYEMEKYWAKRFLTHETLSLKDLENFWYFKNYEAISHKETQLLKRSLGQEKQINLLFAGSGPLPISALLMSQSLKNLRIAKILGVDMDVFFEGGDFK